MRRQMLEESTRGCLPIVAGMLIGLLFCLLISLCSCKAQKVVERVEVPVVVTQEHTIESVKIDRVRDTLIQRDSVYYYVNGDTVRIERWHYLQGSNNVLRVDTLHVYDSVPYPVEVVREVTKTEEVEKPLTWWQKTKMGMGMALLVILALGIMFGGMRIYGKMKRL